MTAPVRVVLIEDNVDVAEGMALLLRHLGCDVRVAHRGDAGIEEAASFEPHLMFIDLGIPGMDGFAIAEKVRQRPPLAKTRLIAFTGYPSYREQAEQAGFYEYLVKPVDVNQLRAIVERTVAGMF